MVQIRLLFLAVILSSCSSTFHLNKAIKKDPSILNNRVVIDTLRVSKIDSIPYIFNDTIHYRLIESIHDTIVEFQYKYITAPITRQQTRLNEKEDRLELKYKFKLGKIMAKYEKQTKTIEARLKKAISRHENKRSNWWLFLVLGLVLGISTRFIKLF